MRTREEIITDMCLTARHDYSLVRNDDEPEYFGGMTEIQRMNLFLSMAQIYDNNIADDIATLTATIAQQQADLRVLAEAVIGIHKLYHHHKCYSPACIIARKVMEDV